MTNEEYTSLLEADYATCKQIGKVLLQDNERLRGERAEAVGLLTLARNATLPHAVRYQIDKFIDRLSDQQGAAHE